MAGWNSSISLDFLGLSAIIASLLFTALELRQVEKAQRVTNLLTITRDHRDIWFQLFDRPELERVLDPKVDLKRKPLTNKEALFVTFLILHLKASFKATNENMFVTAEALQKDIHWFFSLPIPRQVWNQSEAFQDKEFIEFVRGTLDDYAHVTVG